MKTIYGYLADSLRDDAFDYGLSSEHIDWNRLWADKPGFDFSFYEGCVLDVWLTADTPRGICEELAFLAIEVDPHTGAHCAAQRLREIGFDGVHVDNDDGHEYCGYTAGNGHQWRLLDHDWTGEWTLHRA